MAAMLERIRSGNVALKKVQESVGILVSYVSYTGLHPLLPMWPGHVTRLHQCLSFPLSPLSSFLARLYEFEPFPWLMEKFYSQGW